MSDCVLPAAVFLFSLLAFCIAWIVFRLGGCLDKRTKVMEERHNLWKVNAMQLIEAARKYRGPADSVEERGRDARKLDWFIARDKELMK